MMKREYEANQIMQQISMLLINNNLPINSSDFAKWVNNPHLVSTELQMNILEAVIALTHSNWIFRIRILPFLVICRNTLILLKR